ncbi:hypothetical protein ACIPSH_01195 [Streptomyces iakyrus]|uniref:hypothetical protein n=1 Tax=Streptomyces iakyrus TaxID=68219 RepID=UPI003804AD07
MTGLEDEDVIPLSPFVRHHINMPGRCSFQLPDLPGGPRPYATGRRPTRHDSNDEAGNRGGPLPDYRCSA